MATKLRCPQCYKVGGVRRSRFRSSGERYRYWLFPLYGPFRCHACNWRGWLYRRDASPMTIRLLIGLYVTMALVALGGAAILIIHNWPSGRFKY